MEKNRKDQQEALETLIGFNERLIKNMGIIIEELSGKRLEDTDVFLKDIINAMNWEIEVMNGTLSLLNEGEERVDKEKFNSKVVKFGDSIKGKDDVEIAEAIKDLIPEFETLGKAAKEVI